MTRSTSRWSPEPLQISTGPMTKARAKSFKEALNGLIQEVFTSQGSKFITEDEPKLVHMIGTVEANTKGSLMHGILHHDDVAHFDDVASFGDMALLPRGG